MNMKDDHIFSINQECLDVIGFDSIYSSISESLRKLNAESKVTHALIENAFKLPEPQIQRVLEIQESLSKFLEPQGNVWHEKEVLMLNGFEQIAKAENERSANEIKRFKESIKRPAQTKDSGLKLDAALKKDSSCCDYSTPWLKIQAEAISKFFSPRHEVDPKKEEVVEYIERRAREEGIPDPTSTAKAVFTIIKPHDHNPKKRRFSAKGLTH